MTKINILKSTDRFKQHGFTIVELLVVIVVIGILAAITVVSYNGISQKAKVASLQSDLTGASKLLKMYQVEHNGFPTSISSDYCPMPADFKYCLKPSSGNSYDYANYSVNNSSNPQKFSLMANDGLIVYNISNDTSPMPGVISTVIFYDDFNRANGALGVNWSVFYYVPPGYTGSDPMTFNINSNAVSIGNGNSPYTGSVTYTTQTSADVSVSLKVSSYTTNYGQAYASIYLYARASIVMQSDSANCGYNCFPTEGYAVIGRNGSNVSRIVRFKSGGYDIIADAGPVVNQGDTIALKCVGQNITFLINNVVKLTAIDSTLIGPGHVGFGTSGNGFKFTGIVDDFVVNAS